MRGRSWSLSLVNLRTQVQVKGKEVAAQATHDDAWKGSRGTGSAAMAVFCGKYSDILSAVGYGMS